MNGTDPSALPTGYGVYLFQTVLALAAVCLLAYIVLRFGLKRLYGVGRGGDKALMRVVERLPLDPRRSIHLVEVAGRYVLLGTSESGVSFLTEIDGQSLAHSMEEPTSAAPGRGPPGDVDGDDEGSLADEPLGSDDEPA